MDCSTTAGNDGCNGGWAKECFRFIKAEGGIDTEDSYPYIGQNSLCHFSKTNVGATDTGFMRIKEKNETDLAAAVANVGPVAVAIDASSHSFHFYSSGIYDNHHCSKVGMDHAVLAVGYGPGYWLVKNSWAADWGEDGYIRMARGKNLCGIASDASYPLI